MVGIISPGINNIGTMHTINRRGGNVWDAVGTAIDRFNPMSLMQYIYQPNKLVSAGIKEGSQYLEDLGYATEGEHWFSEDGAIEYSYSWAEGFKRSKYVDQYGLPYYYRYVNDSASGGYFLNSQGANASVPYSGYSPVFEVYLGTPEHSTPLVDSGADVSVGSKALQKSNMPRNKITWHESVIAGLKGTGKAVQKTYR